MGNMTIFMSESATPGTSMLRDVDRRGLLLAGRDRMGGHMSAGSAYGAGVRGVRVPVEVHTRGFNVAVKQLKTPVAIDVNGGVGPHPGRPPI